MHVRAYVAFLTKAWALGKEAQCAPVSTRASKICVWENSQEVVECSTSSHDHKSPAKIGTWAAPQQKSTYSKFLHSIHLQCVYMRTGHFWSMVEITLLRRLLILTRRPFDVVSKSSHMRHFGLFLSSWLGADTGFMGSFQWFFGTAGCWGLRGGEY